MRGFGNLGVVAFDRKSHVKSLLKNVSIQYEELNDVSSEDDELVQLRDEVDMIKSQQRKLKTRFDNSQKSLHSSKLMIKSLRDEISKLKVKNNKLATDKYAQELEYQSLVETANNQQSIIVQLRNELAQRDERLAAVAQDIDNNEKLCKQLHLAQEELKKLRLDNRALRRKITSLMGVEVNSKKVIALKEELASRDNVIASLKGEIRALRESIEVETKNIFRRRVKIPLNKYEQSKDEVFGHYKIITEVDYFDSPGIELDYFESLDGDLYPLQGHEELQEGEPISVRVIDGEAHFLKKYPTESKKKLRLKLRKTTNTADVTKQWPKLKVLLITNGQNTHLVGTLQGMGFVVESYSGYEHKHYILNRKQADKDLILVCTTKNRYRDYFDSDDYRVQYLPHASKKDVIGRCSWFIETYHKNK